MQASTRIPLRCGARPQGEAEQLQFRVCGGDAQHLLSFTPAEAAQACILGWFAPSLQACLIGWIKKQMVHEISFLVHACLYLCRPTFFKVGDTYFRPVGELTLAGDDRGWNKRHPKISCTENQKLIHHACKEGANHARTNHARRHACALAATIIIRVNQNGSR